MKCAEVDVDSVRHHQPRVTSANGNIRHYINQQLTYTPPLLPYLLVFRSNLMQALPPQQVKAFY